MCGFIAQLVKHRTGIAEVTASNPVEALIFSGFIFPIAKVKNLTAMIILHFHHSGKREKLNSVPHKSKLVNKVLTLIASEREAAP